MLDQLKSITKQMKRWECLRAGRKVQTLLCPANIWVRGGSFLHLSLITSKLLQKECHGNSVTSETQWLLVTEASSSRLPFTKCRPKLFCITVSLHSEATFPGLKMRLERNLKFLDRWERKPVQVQSCKDVVSPRTDHRQNRWRVVEACLVMKSTVGRNMSS